MRLSIRALGTISVMLLARILMQEDFGIVAKAAMISTFLELITTFGLHAALIQNQSATPRHYDTVWTIHVLRGATIATILVLIAQPASQYFREPALASVLPFYALACLCGEFINVGIVDFQKNLEFDLDFKFNLYKKLAGFVTTLTVALIWRTYWAFVAGVLATSLAALIGSFLLSPYRPRFSLAEWRSLFHFSKWMFSLGIITAISTKLDTFILSRFSTTESVGQYTVAYEVSGATTTELALPVARATMPGLATLNSNPEELRSTYTAALLVLLLIAIPAGVGVCAVAESITLVVLGSKWLAATALVEVLALFGVVRAALAVSSSVYVSSGRVDVLARLAAVSLVVRVCFLGVGFYLGGVVGLAWGLVSSALVYVLMTLAIQHRLQLLCLFDFSAQIWRVLAAAASMYAGLKLMVPVFDALSVTTPIVRLLIQVLFGAIVYLSVILTLWAASTDKRGPEATVHKYLRQRFSSRRGNTTR